MVLPLFDDNSDRNIVPWVNYTFIGINIVVFLLQLGSENRITYALSVVPEEIVTGKDIQSDPLLPTPITPYITLFTAMFMHGGIAHIVGNMLFLWIFGDNIEDYLGHIRYIAFYLVCGVLASLAHVAATYAFNGNPLIPSLGASGAISGVLGGYILLFPKRRVTVILFRVMTEVPAFVAIGMWFVFQIISSLGALGGATGGVAYGAHIGGFVAGLALIKVFALGLPRAEASTAPTVFRPTGRRWRRY